MRFIDLSTPVISGHLRWPVERRLARSHAAGDVSQATWAGWIVHGFTHMDTPRHFDPAGFTTDAVTLDMTAGPAAVVDLSAAAGPDTEITEAMIAAAGAGLRPGDIALVRTGWDRVESIERETFWTRAPWMSAAAARWLLERRIKAVAFDFPQDYCIRALVTGEWVPTLEENVTHTTLLMNGVLMFEYLCNMMAIESPRPYFLGFPIKLPDSDGAPVRAVAVEGWPEGG